jgi:tRNA pseudouridine38-40 synthase
MKNLGQDGHRLCLRIAMDGSAYHGWQAGRSGRGVADVVQRVLAEHLGVTDDVVSSSRTDSGVHAFGLMAHADVPSRYAGRKPEAICALLNGALPSSIRVREARWVDTAFHARFDAKWKEYRYEIWNDAVMNPQRNSWAWHVPGRLDTGAMACAAEQLVGRHDFRAFTARRDGVLGDSFRHLRCLDVWGEGPGIHITLRADGFLYKMCRSITGALVHVGRGVLAAEEVSQWVRSATDRSGTLGLRAPWPIAPAHGLTLWDVGYEPMAAARADPPCADGEIKGARHRETPALQD